MQIFKVLLLVATAQAVKVTQKSSDPWPEPANAALDTAAEMTGIPHGFGMHSDHPTSGSPTGAGGPK